MRTRILLLVVGCSTLATIACSQTPREVAAVSAVAPIYPAIAVATNTFGEADVAVTIDEGGSVSSAILQRGNPLFKASVVDAASRWKFESSSSSHQVTLRFSFRLMAKAALDADVTPIFVPPYQIEVRHRHPGEGVSY